MSQFFLGFEFSCEIARLLTFLLLWLLPGRVFLRFYDLSALLFRGLLLLALALSGVVTSTLPFVSGRLFASLVFNLLTAFFDFFNRLRREQFLFDRYESGLVDHFFFSWHIVF